MAIKDNSPRIVVIIPIFSETKFSLSEKVAPQARQWSGCRWADCYPWQFASSFPKATFLDAEIDSADVLAEWGPEFVRMEDCRLVLFDQRLGALILTLEWLSEGISEERALIIYDEICKFQAERAQKVLQPMLPGVRVTWSFSINILVNFNREFTEADKKSAYEKICQSYSRQSAITFQEKDVDVLHEVGSTGAICLLKSSNHIDYSADRVISLWTIFYTYLAYSIEEYSRMTRDNNIVTRQVRCGNLNNKVQKYVEIYNLTIQRINLFDPFNVCTHAFDDGIYEKCWNVLEVENLNSKIHRTATFFMDNAQDMHKEITGRYEFIVQRLLFFITIVQAIPIFKELIPLVITSLRQFTLIRDVLPEDFLDNYFMVQWLPYAITALIAYGWILIARRSSS